MDYIQQAILKTVVYADLFSYPLNQRQIEQFLISPQRITRRETRQGLTKLLDKGQLIKERNRQLYALSGRKYLFHLWQTRRRLSRKKINRAKRIGRILSLIPTVRLIGLSGGLAVNNAKWGDDIDLFLVTASGTIWLTRLLAILILEVLQVRRRPQTRLISNTICLNMIVDFDHLSLPFNDRDLYSAHEVIQLKPIFVRGDTYRQFLWQNRWVGEFLANSIKRSKHHVASSQQRKSIPYYLLLPLEVLVKAVQLWYMRRKRTSEVIQDGYIRFHPKDARQRVLPKYQWRLTVLKNRLIEKNATHLPLSL